MNQRMNRWTIGVTVVLALSAAGCGSTVSSPDAGDKLGGPGSSVTLRAAVGDPQDAPGTAEQMAAFAAPQPDSQVAT